MRASSDLKGILRGSSLFTLGGVLKKTKKLIIEDLGVPYTRKIRIAVSS